MSAQPTDYDVVIVGGRVAGASLAARLGGMRVLLLERDTFPSCPAASSPVIYAPAMALLDEIGADEAVYAANTPPLREWVIEAAGAFRVTQAIPAVRGRDYAYAVDRARFDAALWALAAARPNVDAQAGVVVTGLLWDGDRVGGVTTRDVATGQARAIRAGVVVGADGRFGVVARRVGASAYDAHTSEPTSVYYAYWRGVRPLAAPSLALHSTGGDYGLLLMDSADGTTAVVVEGRSDVIVPGDGERALDFYERLLRAHPAVWARLADAERVTGVHGMKRVGNLYRRAGGPGWALVGDAVHQKDPLDGQGIYDALYSAKALARALRGWCAGGDWGALLAAYERDVRAETRGMYRATLARVRREIYTRRPAWFMRYPARWLYEDPAYRRRWARLFVRDVDPGAWFSYGHVMGALVRGMWRDLMGARG